MVWNMTQRTCPRASRRFKTAQTSHCATLLHTWSFLWHLCCSIFWGVINYVKHLPTVFVLTCVSYVRFCQTGYCAKTLHMCKQVYTKSMKKFICACKQIIQRGILTLVTHSYLSPWPHPLCTASLLWGFCHYGNHDISSVPVVRFCSREGVNEKRKWRIKREAAKEGGEEMREGVEGKEREREIHSDQRGFCWCLWIPSLHCCMLPGQLQHVGLPACDPSPV